MLYQSSKVTLTRSTAGKLFAPERIRTLRPPKVNRSSSQRKYALMQTSQLDQGNLSTADEAFSHFRQSNILTMRRKPYFDVENEENHQICELDRWTDPVNVLQQLRGFLCEKGHCILNIIDSCPEILLDTVGMLHLLNQDLRLDEDYSSAIVFQPLCEEEGREERGDYKSLRSSRHGKLSLLITRAQALDNTQKVRPGSVIDLGTMVQATDSLDSSTVIHSTSTNAEVYETARMLASKLNSVNLTQLRCCSARSTVVAFRALKLARRFLKLSGKFDLMVCPNIYLHSGVATISLSCWSKKLSPEVHTKEAAVAVQEILNI